MKKQTAVQLILSKWNGKMTQDQFAKWLNKNQNILLAMERQQIIDAHGIKLKKSIEQGVDVWEQTTGEQYFTETYGE